MILVPMGHALALVSVLVLCVTVIVAVHHAEVVAHKVGEPFGTLVFAVAVTAIEVALIVSLMSAGSPVTEALPRDTVFGAIMITCNGGVGLCLLLGGLRYREQSFRFEGASSALVALVTLATLTLVLPTFAPGSPSSTYALPQLVFAAVASLVVFGVFVFIRTVRHRDYFLPMEGRADERAHAQVPSNASAWSSFGLLLLSLIAVATFAKVLSARFDAAIVAAGASTKVIGIAIALLVLLPETSSAVRAALANRLQTSLNLTLGAAVASIGLTIPVVVIVATWLHIPVVLGIEAMEIVLLMLTVLVAGMTLVSGRARMLLGVVHLVIFAAFLFMAFHS
jgi:Ca2+:H+ antiporter